VPYKDPEKERERQRRRRQTPEYKEYHRKYDRAWGKMDRKRNPEKYKQYRDKDYQKHKEKRKTDAMKYYWGNHEYVRQAQKIYFHKNRDYHYERHRRWVMNNPIQFIRNVIGPEIWRVLKFDSPKREGCYWERQLGYTREQLRQHLESQFQEGMDWDNFGTGWHIDHIKPVSSFKLEEFKECWSLDNLQPLWAKDNMSKGVRR